MWKRKKKYVWVLEHGSCGGEGGVLAIYKNEHDAVSSVIKTIGGSEFIKNERCNIWKCCDEYYCVFKWEVY